MEFSYYSLAIVESRNSTDMAQLLVFVRGIVSEELGGMQSMQGRTTGKNICSAVIDRVPKKLSSDFKNLVGSCTDGAPAMCGKTNGAMTLLQEHIERKIIINHCIIQRQVLCSKVLKFDHVMLVVVYVVNDLRTRKLSHRLFKSFLEKADSEYGDVVYTPM